MRDGTVVAVFPSTCEVPDVVIRRSALIGSATSVPLPTWIPIKLLMLSGAIDPLSLTAGQCRAITSQITGEGRIGVKRYFRLAGSDTFSVFSVGCWCSAIALSIGPSVDVESQLLAAAPSLFFSIVALLVLAAFWFVDVARLRLVVAVDLTCLN